MATRVRIVTKAQYYNDVPRGVIKSVSSFLWSFQDSPHRRSASRRYDRWAKSVKSTVERRRNTWIRNTRTQRKGPLLFSARVGIKSVRTLRVAKVYWLFEAIKPAEQFDSRNTRDCRVYFPSFAKRTRVNTTFETIKDHRFRMTLQMNWRYHGERCLRIVSRCSLQVLDRFVTYFESVRETGIELITACLEMGIKRWLYYLRCAELWL